MTSWPLPRAVARSSTRPKQAAPRSSIIPYALQSCPPLKHCATLPGTRMLQGLVGRGGGRGRGRGAGKPDQTAILMASLFGEADDDEDAPQRRRCVRCAASAQRAVWCSKLPCLALPPQAACPPFLARMRLPTNLPLLPFLQACPTCKACLESTLWSRHCGTGIHHLVLAPACITWRRHP